MPSSGTAYFGLSSVYTGTTLFSQVTSLVLREVGVFNHPISQVQQNDNGLQGLQCGVCAKPVDRFKVTDAGSMNVLVVAFCHSEEEARIVPRDNLGVVAVPSGYVAFAEKARALMVEAIPVGRPTVRLITLEEKHEHE